MQGLATWMYDHPNPIRIGTETAERSALNPRRGTGASAHQSGVELAWQMGACEATGALFHAVLTV